MKTLTFLSHDYALVKNVVVIMDFHSLSHVADSADICLGQETFANKLLISYFSGLKKLLWRCDKYLEQSSNFKPHFRELQLYISSN